METIRMKTWARFRDWLAGYFREDTRRRQQLIFRGHSDARWKLLPTLDRLYKFETDAERKQFSDELMEAFRRELMHVDSNGAQELDDVAMELLARHQSLPSLLMDWTESPYIGAYFAFANCSDKDKQQVAIWVMDRAKLEQTPALEIIDDHALLRFNQRAIRQRGVFVRHATGKPLEEVIGDALTQIQIPARQFRIALGELDEMTINATYLFSDMEAAARTAQFRAASRRYEP